MAERALPSRRKRPDAWDVWCDTRTPDLSIQEHIALAERHAQRALDLAYSDEPQPFFVRLAIGKIQSKLLSLIVHKRLR